jgi:hypothetical protein
MEIFGCQRIAKRTVDSDVYSDGLSWSVSEPVKLFQGRHVFVILHCLPLAADCGVGSSGNRLVYF